MLFPMHHCLSCTFPVLPAFMPVVCSLVIRLLGLGDAGSRNVRKKGQTLVDACTFIGIPVPCTTNLAVHTQAFLGKTRSTETQLAIRVKWYHDANLGSG